MEGKTLSRPRRRLKKMEDIQKLRQEVTTKNGVVTVKFLEKKGREKQ
ncbi:hypothetical protein LCGC14_1502140 [marine sediment metagenome]|uniref:Uncharacterized protein n=1 Tax=marine sediment metagenome TaxID=412755 RepID=A0A0F9M586_9ZZZZ